MNDHSTLLWGHAISFWDTWGVRAMIGGAALGAMALAASLFSSFVLYRVADRTQTELKSTAQTLGLELEQQKTLTAEAMQRAAEAQLELDKFRAPRLPSPEALTEVVAKIRPFAGTHFDIGHGLDDLEQMDFLWLLEPKLSEAGWVHVDWVGGATFVKPNWPGNHVYGRVAANDVSIELAPQFRDKLLPAANALVEALNGIGIKAYIKFFNNSSMNADAIHILVGPKR